MPTADEYEAAANTFDSVAQATGTLMEPARGLLNDAVMVGGRLTQMVSEELESAAVILDQATLDVMQLAQTCRAQAEVARQAMAAAQDHALAYAAYESALRDWQEDQDAGRNPNTPAPEAPPAPDTPPAFVTI